MGTEMITVKRKEFVAGTTSGWVVRLSDALPPAQFFFAVESDGPCLSDLGDAVNAGCFVCSIRYIYTLYIYFEVYDDSVDL